jgi:hypothetical protein
MAELSTLPPDMPLVMSAIACECDYEALRPPGVKVVRAIHVGDEAQISRARAAVFTAVLL